MSKRLHGVLGAALALAASSSVEAGWPFTSSGPRRGSPEFYAAHACDPVGDRQKCHHGKLWPPFARPVGDDLPCVHKYHASHYWPYPYNLQDREDVDYVRRLQIANGWLQATTLYEYHFDPQTHQLNSSGRSHVGWVLGYAPQAFRQLYVQSSSDPTVNDARLASIQQTLAGVSGGDPAIPVMFRLAEPLGRPATEVEQIFLNRQENAIPPVIQYQAGTGGGGSGS